MNDDLLKINERMIEMPRTSNFNEEIKISILQKESVHIEREKTKLMGSDYRSY